MPRLDKASKVLKNYSGLLGTIATEVGRAAYVNHDNLAPLLRRDGDSMDAYHLFDAPTFHDECQRLAQINADLLDQMEALEAAHRRTLDKLTKNSMYSAVGVLEETIDEGHPFRWPERRKWWGH